MSSKEMNIVEALINGNVLDLCQTLGAIKRENPPDAREEINANIQYLIEKIKKEAGAYA